MNRRIVKDDILRQIMARKLRELRIKNDLSQEDLGSMVGLSRTSLCNLEAGEHGMTPTLVFRLCAVFNCDYAELFPTPEEHQADIGAIKKPTPEQKLAEKIRKMKQRIAILEKDLPNESKPNKTKISR